MKHPSDKKTSIMARQLAEIRKRTGVTEKKPGAFYRKGEPILELHEDPKGAYAKLKSKGQWIRFHVKTQAEWKTLFAELDKALRAPGKS